MKIHHHGGGGKLPGELHVLYVVPAAEIGGRGEVPTSWVDHANRPMTFVVEFRNGTAEVDPMLGEHLVRTGQAFRTPLRVSAAWE